MSNNLFNNLASLLLSEKEIVSERIKGDKTVVLIIRSGQYRGNLFLSSVALRKSVGISFYLSATVSDKAKSYTFISIVHSLLKINHMTFKSSDSVREDNLA